MTSEQVALLADLVQKGALITSNDLLANVSSFYSTLISVLIATFFVFGALSFFAVQANARRQIEDVTEAVVSKTTVAHFGSLAFDREVREKIDSKLQLELESYDDLYDLQNMSQRVKELSKRVDELRSGNGPAGLREE